MSATLHGLVTGGRDLLIDAGIGAEDAALDAEVLARHVLGCDRASFVVRMNDAAPDTFRDRFFALVSRRATREPVAYIVGHREFWGLEFEVTPDVLIPRPETEMIVEEAVEEHRTQPPAFVIDVGTGSGCLVVALGIEFASTRFIATDTSEAALGVARRNAARHQVDSRIEFRRADLLKGLVGSADLIVSNPPYVSEEDRATLPPEVARFEPSLALFAGKDGLVVLDRLFTDAPPLLTNDGRLIVEVGYDQHTRAAGLAAKRGWRVERIRADLQGIPRTMVLKKVATTHG